MNKSKYKAKFAEKLVEERVMISKVLTTGYSIIDEICNDYESRTCENCRYVTEFPSGMICQRGFDDGHNPLFEVSVFSDFGCNKFERRINGL